MPRSTRRSQRGSKRRIGDDVYSDDGEAIEQVLARQLAARGWRIGVAESCTGGLIA